MLSDDELRELFLDLHMELGHVRIETLVTQSQPFGKIDYKPDYQRNYIWNLNKATLYIESVILGTEIPPKIFWYENCNELLDGRQRYETLIKFYNNEFSLQENGLYVLKHLRNKKFKDLKPEIQSLFLNKRVRTLLITMTTPSKWDDYKTDQIKIIIFRRYNMGLTPLKEVEIARAKYTEHDLNQYFLRRFKEDKSNFTSISSLCTNVKNKNFYDLVELVMSKIRMLLVLDKLKVDHYVTNDGKVHARNIFDNLSGSKEHNKRIYKSFNKKIQILKVVQKYLELHGFGNYINLYETLYWAISVIEKEKISIDRCMEENFCNSLIKFVSENKTPMLVNNGDEISVYMANKIRFHNIARFFEGYFELNLSKYILVTTDYKNKVKELKKKIFYDGADDTIKALNLIYSDARQEPIYELLHFVKTEKMLIRPPYQRSENPDIVKASGIIESILLKFKILPIFIFVRKDGIRELIDGQQRLLAVLGFLGKEYKNEEGEFKQSNKHRFKLKGLEVLKELNGKEFECDDKSACLSELERNKILNASLPVVEIHEERYPDFNPVDLFIRLNKRPFPVRNHTFEVWNTILPNDLLKSIKDNTKKHEDWFYFKNKNIDARMENEELYTIILFLEARKCEINEIDNKDIVIYKKNGCVHLKRTPKENISKFLYDIAREDKFNTIKNKAEDFIEKIKILLGTNSSCDAEFLKNELNKLVVASKKKTQRSRTLIMALWYLVSAIDIAVIRNNNNKIKNDVKNLLNYFIQSKDNLNLGYKLYDDYLSQYVKFRKKYTNYIECADATVVHNKKIKRKPVAQVSKENKIASTLAAKTTRVIKEKENTVVNVSINFGNENTIKS